MHNNYYIVMWIIRPALCSNVLECDLKLCKSLDDYVKNTDNCRDPDEAVNREDIIWWSYVPFTGIANFYSYNKFYGGFELMEGLVLLFTMCCSCCYGCIDDARNDPNHGILGYQAASSLILTAVTVLKVVLIIFSGSFEWYEFVIMIISLSFSFISCNRVHHSTMRCWIASAFINAIVVGIMEMTRDIYMAKYSDIDGKGCPFV